MSNKIYYYCSKCQMQYTEKVAEHNDYKCSSCNNKLIKKGDK